MLICLCAILIFISIVTHSPANDTKILRDAFGGGTPGKLFSTPLQNKGGIVGVLIAYALLGAFGYLSILFPLALLLYGGLLTLDKEILPYMKKFAYGAGILFLFGLFISLFSSARAFMPERPGLAGALGHHIARVLKSLIGSLGSYTLVLSLLLISLSLVLPSLFGRIGEILLSFFDKLKAVRIRKTKGGFAGEKIAVVDADADSPKVSLWKKILRIKKPEPLPMPNQDIINPPPTEEPAEELSIAGESSTKRKKKTIAKTPEITVGGYRFPGIELLSDPPSEEPPISRAELQETVSTLKDTLRIFGVELANDDVELHPGPIITRFEFKPAPGIKISQIVNLADDLALAMKAKRIRIVAPIPGKSAVGVEIPNRTGQTVYLKEIITSDEFQNTNMTLPLAIGKNIAGRPFIVDLAAMPHLLIAGATGSGKSVCLNAIITSLLYKLPPENIRFIMIDPKMLELSSYDDLPHLAKPVVTDVRYAEKTLGEAVVEMEDRYRRLAKAAVRNIADYNKAASEPLPYVVVIVDELADLMMSGSNRIETLITRLAQMARAVGIHLILATQRPSVDVITGLIKANFSTRIAFQVATKVDSRTILDVNGAEKLLGKGDMLYMNPAHAEPIRAHGAYISTVEIRSICKFLGDQEYKSPPMAAFAGSAEDAHQYDPASDALFKEAIALVIRHKQGSVSLLQRRLGIGYQRAARLIDQLEEAGIVGPYDGSKAREVLVDEEYLKQKVD